MADIMTNVFSKCKGSSYKTLVRHCDASNSSNEWAFHCLAAANEAIKLAGGVQHRVRPMDAPDDDQTTTVETTEPAPIGMEVA